jgi:hypothetical protein
MKVFSLVCRWSGSEYAESAQDVADDRYIRVSTELDKIGGICGYSTIHSLDSQKQRRVGQSPYFTRCLLRVPYGQTDRAGERE